MTFPFRKNAPLRTVFAVAAAMIAGSALANDAATFPSRPIHLIVPFAAGNTLDASARVMAEAFSRNTGQPIIIDNRPGGAGAIGAQAAANANPDGYTVLMASSGMLAINPHTFSKLAYDPEKSFKAITGFVGSPMVMAIHKDVPATDLNGFIDWTRKHPNTVSYGSFTAGNPSHFAGVILNQKANLDMAHIPYNGTGPAVQNLVGGQIHATFAPSLAVAPFLEGGRVKILATTSPERRPNLPEVPTFSELGYPELDILMWTTFMVPAGTPDAIVEKLSVEFGKALKDTEVAAKLDSMDFVLLPSNPEDTRKFITDESKRWGEAVKLSGFKAAE